MSSLSHKLKHELREIIPVTLYFFFTFQLLVLTQALMLRQHGIHVSSFVSATVLAMVVAKVVLIADHFKLVNRFPAKPLIYNVGWKTAIYYSASFVVRYVEHLIRFWPRSGGFAEANRRLFNAIVWPHFFALHLWLLVLLLMFCSIRELVRALGRERIIKMFFSDPQAGGHEE